MTIPLMRKFELAGPRGDGRHAYVNADGAFLGCGVPLLERGALGQWRPRDRAVLERLLTIGYGTPVELRERQTRLGHVAQALNNGDLTLAGISLVQMRLPPLPSADHARQTAKADGLLVKYNPDWEDEPRVPAGDPAGGQWTGEGEAGDEPAHVEPAAYRGDDTEAKKERFVDAHLEDAQRVADQLGVPVENILGVSAEESGWGEHPFAAQGNNYFGIHWPAPFATGYAPAQGNSKVKVATFASYADSARSIAAITESFLRGVGDPRDFAAALHRHGFGVGNRTYVHELTAIIRGLRSIVSRRNI